MAVLLSLGKLNDDVRVENWCVYCFPIYSASLSLGCCNPGMVIFISAHCSKNMQFLLIISSTFLCAKHDIHNIYIYAHISRFPTFLQNFWACYSLRLAMAIGSPVNWFPNRRRRAAREARPPPKANWTNRCCDAATSAIDLGAEKGVRSR